MSGQVLAIANMGPTYMCEFVSHQQHPPRFSLTH